MIPRVCIRVALSAVIGQLRPTSMRVDRKLSPCPSSSSSIQAGTGGSTESSPLFRPHRPATGAGCQKVLPFPSLSVLIVQLRARVARKFSPFPELLATNDALEFALGFPTGGPHVRDAFSGQNALELAASRCSLSAQSSGPPQKLRRK